MTPIRKRGHPLARPIAFGAIVMCVLTLVAGCAAPARQEITGVGSMRPLGIPVPPMKPIGPVNLQPRPRDLRLDLNWLERDEFFVPGARRMGPITALGTKLAGARKTQFPSAELCVSPDKRYVLYHDGLKQKQRGIHHWLMLLRNEATAYPNTIFGTRLAFDASWAEDSQRFAVTHFVGDNSSEVFVVDTTDLERQPVSVQRFIEEFFPERLWSEPMFVRAYRWTEDGRLVVRAIARARQEPYELFGCEVLVRCPGAGAEPQVSYLRGYLKPQDDDAARQSSSPSP